MKNSGLGWAPEIPVGWNLIRAKYLLTKLDRSFRAEDTPLICTNKGKVIERGGTNYGLVSSDEMNYQGVHPGDLLIHGMDTWHGAIAMSDLSGKCTTVVHVCDSDQDKRFLCYYYQALAYQNVYKLISNGIRQNTSDFRSFSKFGEIPTFVPPLREQQSIADYLDERCAAIDEVRRTIEDEIEALRRLRRATIHRAVTKSLDEGVPMRDSGIEWIGEIPAGWQVRRIQHLTDCNAETLSDSTIPTFEFDYIDISSVSEGSIDCVSHQVFSKAPSRARRVVRHNDVLISTVRTYLKAVARVDRAHAGCVASTGFCVLRPKKDMNSRWFGYAVSDDKFIQEVAARSVGVSYPAINASDLIKMHLPYPPLFEQRRIADYLDERCAAIDSVIDTRTRQLQRLDDYRKALIFAYVTGKKEAPSHE